MNQNTYNINKFKNLNHDNSSGSKLSPEEHEKAALIAEAIYNNYNERPQVRNIYESIDNPTSLPGLITKYLLIGFCTVSAFIISEIIVGKKEQ